MQWKCKSTKMFNVWHMSSNDMFVTILKYAFSVPICEIKPGLERKGLNELDNPFNEDLKSPYCSKSGRQEEF